MIGASIIPWLANGANGVYSCGFGVADRFVTEEDLRVLGFVYLSGTGIKQIASR